MYSNFFQPCFTELTRIVARNKPSLIGYIFINSCHRTLHGGNLFNKAFDHLPNFILVLNLNEQKLKTKIQIRDMKNLQKGHFCRDMQNENLMKFSDTYILDGIYDKIQDKLISVINRHAHFKVLKNKEAQLKCTPWINKNILKLIKEKNQTCKKYTEDKDLYIYLFTYLFIHLFVYIKT